MKPNLQSSRSFTWPLHTLNPRLEASAKLLKLLASRDLRQESIQPERQFVVMKSSPPRILPARFKAEGMFPGDHIQQVTPPFELCFGVLLSPKYMHQLLFLFIYSVPSRWFVGTVVQTYQDCDEASDALEING